VVKAAGEAAAARVGAIAYLPPDIMYETSVFDPTRAGRLRPGSATP
jgi:hypothetical protein